MNGGPHRNVVSEQADAPGPLHKPPTQRAFGLEPGDHHDGFGSGQVLPQMMADAPGITHAAGRDDYRPCADPVERLRLVDARCELEVGEVRAHLVPSCQALRLFIEQFQMPAGDPRGFGRHRRVHKNHQVVQSSFAG